MDSPISEKITYIRDRLTRIQRSIKRKEIEYEKYMENYVYNPQYRDMKFEYQCDIRELYEQYDRYYRKLERYKIRLERMK